MMLIAMDVEPMFPYTNPAQAILSGMAQIGPVSVEGAIIFP
jgi:hypothetical protein